MIFKFSVVMLQPQPVCLEHGEQLQFYCQDEELLACVECVTESHKTHKLCSAKKAASEHRVRMMQCCKINKSLKKCIIYP